MAFRRAVKFAFVFLIVSGSMIVWGQQTAMSSATVHGIVADPDDAVIPGATVTFTPASGKSLTTVSQGDGTFNLKAVPTGSYAVTVTMQGFASYVKQAVRVAAGQSLALNVKMVIQAESEVIQVSASTAQVSVDSDSNASSTVIKGKDLDALSDDPDELSSELSALAGPAAGPNGGQIYVDGFTGGQLPPKSSIREIRINQNPFSSQFDKLGYGRIEVFTKPGTDKYHGNFSTQGGDKLFNTSNPFLGASNTQPSYHTIFMMGSISGPINRIASFAVNGSHRTIQDNNIVNPGGFYASSATATTPCQPGDLTCTYFSSIPASARAVSHPQARTDVSPRIDLALGEKNTMTIRFQYNDNSVQNAGVGNTNLPSAGYNSESGEKEIQVSDTQIVSSRVINETRFEFGRDTGSRTPVSTAPTLSVQGIFTAGGTSQGTTNNTQNHIELQNYTSIALAKHFIRMGGRLRTTSESLTSNQGSNGTFTYSYLLDPCSDPNPGIKKPSNCAGVTTPCAVASISSYQCGIASQFALTKINEINIGGRVTDVGLYAEDDWKVKPNLTLTFGTRLETQNVINSPHDFAPRVSFAYGIPRHGKPSVTVIRGGYGMFYDRFGLNDYLTTQRLNGSNQVTSILVNPGAACQPSNLSGCGTATAGRTTTYTLGNNLRSSYTLQSAIGFDQQVGRAGTISVNYLNARGVHEYLSRDFFNGTSYNYQFQSGGVFHENQILVSGNARVRRMSFFGFVSMNFADANTSGPGFFPTSNTNTKADYGRAAFTHTGLGVFGGNVQLPYAFSLNPFMIAQSGTVYNLTTGLDPNSTSIYNARPYFANGDSGNCLSSSAFSATQTGNLTPVPINYCTGPSNFTFNLRASRVFGFGEKTGSAAAGGNPGGPGGPMGRGGHGGPGGGMGMGAGSSGRRYTLTLGAQAFNLFNVIPYGTPTSSLSSPRFGQFTTLATGPFSSATAVRRITLQATFNF